MSWEWQNCLTQALTRCIKLWHQRTPFFCKWARLTGAPGMRLGWPSWLLLTAFVGTHILSVWNARLQDFGQRLFSLTRLQYDSDRAFEDTKLFKPLAFFLDLRQHIRINPPGKTANTREPVFSQLCSSLPSKHRKRKQHLSWYFYKANWLLL